MLARIQVGLKPAFRDSFGETTCNRIKNDLHLPVDSVRTIKVFTVEADINDEQLKAAAVGPYSDPVTQDWSLGPLALDWDYDFDWLIEVGFRPGVTDNEGHTAAQALELMIGRKLNNEEAVYTSTQFLCKGTLSQDDVETIAKQGLANELIQYFNIINKEDFVKAGGFKPQSVKVIDNSQAVVAPIDLNISADELMRISKEGILALTLEEMKFIRDYLQRPDILEQRQKMGLSEKAADVELEALAQTWSEHCKHKIFAGNIEYEDLDAGTTETITSLFDTCIRQPTADIRAKMGDDDWCLSVFKDNAGVISFNDDWNVVFKVETHNSPSALDPYGGALTGIVGVNRDPFGTGMGAKLMCNTNMFCFATPFYDKAIPARLLHPKRIFEGVRTGVEHGGNKSGIPTVNGSLYFDDRYAGKPLVFCGTVGIMPTLMHGKPSEDKIALPGDIIVMTGGRIGKDGIHGATFSSEELNENSPATAVQIGDPITQKKMFDCLIKARDLGLYRCITDNGAGGLSSSVGEMGEFTNGFELHLDRCPLKYAGLQPWEIFLSEAQERMTLAVQPEKLEEFMNLCTKMDTEATVLGTFTDSGKFHCLYDGKTVAYLDMEFVYKALPPMEMQAKWQQKTWDEPTLPATPDLEAELTTMLGRLNICSKEYVVRQYDHEVQGASVVKPLTGAQNDGPSDAAVVRPVFDSFAGLVISHGVCPRYSDIDTYHMVAAAMDEAVRNAICVGGSMKVMAGLDNFCWCDPIQSEKTPDGHYKLAQLVRANRALAHYAKVYNVPPISGKDSMKNDYMMEGTKISIPPTLLFSVIAKIDDVRKAVTMDAKQAGDIVYVLGTTYNELGASEYAVEHGAIGNNVPVVREEDSLPRFHALEQAIADGLVASCHDCSDGGLGVALAETAFSGDLGMEIDLTKAPMEGIERDDVMLFSESQSRFVVTVQQNKAAAFEAVMADTGLGKLGTVTKEMTMKMSGLNGQAVMNADLGKIKAAWQATLDF